jgi:hypothetical protein
VRDNEKGLTYPRKGVEMEDRREDGDELFTCVMKRKKVLSMKVSCSLLQKLSL